jgi:hypothetical protein
LEGKEVEMFLIYLIIYWNVYYLESPMYWIDCYGDSYCWKRYYIEYMKMYIEFQLVLEKELGDLEKKEKYSFSIR